MKSKHLVALAALFLFAAVARTDDVQGPVTDTSLTGKLHAPGESISYNFFVESFEINGYGEAILNGTFTDRGAGLAPRTTTFSADYFFLRREPNGCTSAIRPIHHVGLDGYHTQRVHHRSAELLCGGTDARAVHAAAAIADARLGSFPPTP